MVKASIKHGKNDCVIISANDAEYLVQFGFGAGDFVEKIAPEDVEDFESGWSVQIEIFEEELEWLSSIQ